MNPSARDVVRLPPARTAADVMTMQVVTVGPDDSLPAAWELLSRGRVHHLAVVAADGRCLGLLDDRMLAVEWLAVAPGAVRRAVASLLPARVHSVPAAAPLHRVARLMAEERLTALPVVEGRMRLVGLVTDRALVAELARATAC